MYDLIVIGAGPAGMSAALYAARGGLKTLVLDGIGYGGQMNYTYEIANYPGVTDHPSGDELAKRMRMQAESFGAKIGNESVNQIKDIANPIKSIVTRNHTYQTKTLILATGAKARKLGAEGEDRFSGIGVSYCATCDGAFFKGRVTVVAGGGNAAFEDALYLSKYCKKVYLINHGDQFRADAFLVEKAEQNEKIELIKNNVITKIIGDTTVKEILLQNTKTESIDKLECSGVFVAVGREASTQALPTEIAKNERGFIITDRNMRTNLSGVFAAGDVRDTPLRQIITAAADGAIAATAAIQHNTNSTFK